MKILSVRFRSIGLHTPKKTEKTNKADLDLAAKRYRDLLQELG